MTAKEDQRRLDAIHHIPCVCCHSMGMGQPLKTEAHHLVDMGDREKSGGDQATAAICGWHHRAEPIFGLTRKYMLSVYGPSMKWQGKKGAFARRFGTQRELLKNTNKLLEEYGFTIDTVSGNG